MGVEPLTKKNQKKKDVIILLFEDWEGLFIDGILIDEGHSLGEGNNFLYLLKKSEEYMFTSKDVTVKYLTNEDEEYLLSRGCFPKILNELNGEY